MNTSVKYLFIFTSLLKLNSTDTEICLPIMACLDTIIGLSKTPCNCFTDSSEESFNVTESDSGLYLEELVSVDLANSSDCGEAGPWKIMRAAFENALLNTTIDVRKAIQKKYKTLHFGHKSMIGGRDVSVSTITAAAKGLRVTGNGIQGSYITIKSATFYNTETGLFDFLVLDEHSNEIHSQEVSLDTSNTWSAAQTPETEWKLPLWNDDGQPVIYYIVHTCQNTKENTDPCGCTSGQKTRSWQDVADFQGVYSDDLGDGSFMSYNDMGGMRLSIETSCETDYELCQLQGDDRNMLAKAIQFCAGAKLIEHVLIKNLSGFASTVSIEVKQQMMNSYAMQYAETINHITEVITPGNCYKCNNGGIRRSTLI